MGLLFSLALVQVNILSNRGRDYRTAVVKLIFAFTSIRYAGVSLILNVRAPCHCNCVLDCKSLVRVISDRGRHGGRSGLGFSDVMGLSLLRMTRHKPCVTVLHIGVACFYLV